MGCDFEPVLEFDVTPEEPDPEFQATLKAAEQGDADAQIRIGYMYTNGGGVPKDEAEGVKWYRKVAEHGNDAAQYELYLAYYQGKGVPQDDAEAYV